MRQTICVSCDSFSVLYLTSFLDGFSRKEDENRRPVSCLADRLAQLVEHRTAVREVAGSNLDRTNTQGLQITEEKVLPL